MSKSPFPLPILSAALSLPALVLTGACDDASLTTEPIDVGHTSEGKADSLYGGSLSCISDDLDGSSAQAIRVTLESNADGAFVRGGVFALFDATEPVAEIDLRASGVIGPEAIKLSFKGGEMSLRQALVGLYNGTAQFPGHQETRFTCYEQTVYVRGQYRDGHCVDYRGREARNPLSVQFVRETGYGECADLGGESLNGSDVSYPGMNGWNLRGADLSGARLFFADLLDVDLSGATVSDFEFGYARVTAVVDEFTVDSPCAPTPGSLTISCQQ